MPELPLSAKRWIVVLLGAYALGAAGCTHPLAALMVSAPEPVQPSGRPVESAAAAGEPRGRPAFVGRGGAAAGLLVGSVIEPTTGQPPRGTVLVLHGLGGRGLTMLPKADALARAGYRAVLVDLRGQGRSTGRYLTFGIQEARDLSQVIDALERHALGSGPIGVCGISYGATTAIHLAARDPRVQAVVAIQPFGMLRPEVPYFGGGDRAGHRLAHSRPAVPRGAGRGRGHRRLRSRPERRHGRHPADGGPRLAHSRHQRPTRALLEQHRA